MHFNNRADKLYEHLRGDYCIYCGEHADTEDHVIPRSHIAKLLGLIALPKQLITVPACSNCNTIAGAKIFKSIGAKRRYILNRLRTKYRKVLEIPNWSEAELESIECRNLKTAILTGLALRDQLRRRLSWRNVKSATAALSLKGSGRNFADRNAKARFTCERQHWQEMPGEDDTISPAQENDIVGFLDILFRKIAQREQATPQQQLDLSL
jgi:hypothetical protein